MKKQIDKQALLLALEERFNKFIAVLSLFSDQEINLQSSYGGWTAGQVVDHIIKGTEGLPDSRTREAKRVAGLLVNNLRDTFLNYDIKMESPDFIYPADGPHNKKVLVEALEKNKLNHLETINTCDLAVLCMDFEFPTYGLLTRYEWLMFIQFHIQRHEHQLTKIYESLHKRNQPEAIA